MTEGFTYIGFDGLNYYTAYTESTGNVLYFQRKAGEITNKQIPKDCVPDAMLIKFQLKIKKGDSY